MIDIERLLTDYNIDYITSGKNISASWGVGINDPYAHDTGYHMGINPVGAYCYSWKTGGAQLNKVLADVLNITWYEADKLIEEYSTVSKIEKMLNKKKFVIVEGKPSKVHKDYLRSRGFNANYLIDTYDIRADGYKLVFPVYYKGAIVSYQERDIRKKYYKACKKEIAILNYKDILYNIDRAVSDFIVVVEGLFDVFRLGDDAVATFGTSWTKNQVKVLLPYKKVIIMFDNEDNADTKKRANGLGAELSMLGVDVEVNWDYLRSLNIHDAGELSQEQADDFMNKWR